MDIFTQLKSDHDQVKALFQRIEANASGNATTRTDLFRQVKDALTAHSRAEDETFYSEIEDDEGLEDKIVDARKEHETIEKLLDELDMLDGTDARWMAKFRELRQEVEAHVHEEETVIFPLARQVLDEEDAEELGNTMVRLEESFREGPQANA